MSFSDFIKEKTGISAKGLHLAEACKKYFSYDSCKEDDGSMYFYDVTLKEDIELCGKDNVLKKDTNLKALHITENGWIKFCKDDKNVVSAISIKNKLLENIYNDMLAQTAQIVTDVAPQSIIQQNTLIEISNIVSSLKKLSLQQIEDIKNSLGPSLEEQILREILKTIFKSEPEQLGLSNGV